MNGALTKMKFAALAIVGVVTLGMGFASIQLTSGQPRPIEPKQATEKPQDAAKAPAAADAKQAQTAKNQEMESVAVKGRVLDPNGKPVAGAKLFVSQFKYGTPFKPEDIAVKQVAVSGGDGGFAFTYKSPRLVPGYVFAHLDGFGVDWAALTDQGAMLWGNELAGKPAVDNVVLKLVKDQPIIGRIVDTEGKPVGGAAVDVTSIAVPSGNNLDEYLAAWKRDRHSAKQIKYLYVPFVPLDAIFGKVKTDKDGQFKLNGAGAERIVDVRARGRGMADSRLWVLTRAGIDPKPANEAAAAQARAEQGAKMRLPVLYGPGSTIVLEPGKVVEGVVTDKATGKPLAGVQVAPFFRNGDDYIITDANGNYRLEGLPQEKTYRIRATPPQESSYLKDQSAEAPSTPGAAPVRVDIALAKGVALTGRVLDRQTGKGVKAMITAFAYSVSGGGALDPTKWPFRTVTDNEGRFRAAAAPGTWLLTVEIKNEGMNPYRMARPGQDYIDFCKAATGRPPEKDREFDNIVKVVDLKEGGGGVQVDLFAERGVTAKLIVQDAGGKPLTGAFVSGLTADRLGALQLKNDASTTVYGLDPEEPRRPRRLAVLHPEKKLGGTVTVRGDEKEPVTIKLVPLGTVTGRFLDIDGIPFAGVDVSLHYNDLVASRVYDAVNRTTLQVKTDKDGRFTLPALLPCLKFYIQRKKGDTEYYVEPEIGDREVEPGKTLDLGERKLRPVD